jgi:tRNA1Val (adenine37-N6)-methyltransferase
LDAVVTNPPYVRRQAGLHGDNPAKTIARHEVHGSLEDFFAASARMLKPKGSLFMVHRPSRLADLMADARANGLEPKTLRMVAPGEGSAPNLVLIHFVKGGRRELILLPTLCVYGPGRAYTPEILRIYEK